MNEELKPKHDTAIVFLGKQIADVLESDNTKIHVIGQMLIKDSFYYAAVREQRQIQDAFDAGLKGGLTAKEYFEDMYGTKKPTE